MKRKINVENNKQNNFIASCVNCGILLKEEKANLKDNKYFCGNCSSIYEQNKLIEKTYLKNPNGILRIFIYIITVLNPLIGFLFGAIYFSQENSENKNFGKRCFIFAFIGILIYVIFFIGLTFLTFILSGGNISNFQFYEGYY